MLSDSERRRLAEIESSLRADDPVFVQHFDTEPRPRLRRTALALLAFIIAVTITLIALVRGNVLAAVVGLTAAGVSVGLWATFPRRSRWCTEVVWRPPHPGNHGRR